MNKELDMLELDKIYNMDCIEGMKQLPDNSIDSIITDVPYNLGNGNPNLIKFKNRQNMNKANIDKWNKDFDPILWLPEAKRILKDKGNIFIFTSHRNFGDYFNWMNNNFERTFFGAWHKTNPTPQVRKCSFLSSLELFVCSWNTSHKWNFSNQNDMHNLIEYPICMGDERTEHSAQKPLEVMAYIIKVTTDENDIVLDPFLGSGTTAIASRVLNRHFIGFEIDKNYYNISLKRVMNIPERLENWIES